MLLLLAGDRAFSDPEATSHSTQDPLEAQAKSRESFPERDDSWSPPEPTVLPSTWPTTIVAITITNDTMGKVANESFSQHSQPAAQLPTDSPGQPPLNSSSQPSTASDLPTQATTEPFCPEPLAQCSDSDRDSSEAKLSEALTDFSVKLYHAFSATKMAKTNMAFPHSALPASSHRFFLGLETAPRATWRASFPTPRILPVSTKH